MSITLILIISYFIVVAFILRTFHYLRERNMPEPEFFQVHMLPETDEETGLKTA